MIEAILAVYSDWGIGDGTTQPVVLSADRKHFRDITMNSAVIVGRKTLGDFPGGKPLKGRCNIVVTRQDIEIEGAEVVHSTAEALAAAEKHVRCFVIGGASIFEQFLPHTGKVHLTKLDCRPESSRFFPNLDELPEWKCTDCGEALEENGISYRFCTYERIEND